MKRFLPLLAVAVICVSCCLLRSKKPGYANTQWICVYELFVADAGTETTTATLSFGDASKFTLVEKSVMPPYSGTHVNPDGTIDTFPGHIREYTRQGTYEVKGNEIVLKQTDGTVHTLRIVGDKLESDDLSFQKLVFEKNKPEK